MLPQSGLVGAIGALPLFALALLVRRFGRQLTDRFSGPARRVYALYIAERAGRRPGR